MRSLEVIVGPWWRDDLYLLSVWSSFSTTWSRSWFIQFPSFESTFWWNTSVSFTSLWKRLHRETSDRPPRRAEPQRCCLHLIQPVKMLVIVVHCGRWYFMTHMCVWVCVCVCVCVGVCYKVNGFLHNFHFSHFVCSPPPPWVDQRSLLNVTSTKVEVHASTRQWV